MERTLVVLKPDAVQRGLVGELLGRFERKGLALVALRMLTVTEATARAHYAPHEGKPFYEPLVRFITSAPSVAMVLEGMSAIAVVRKMVGSTFGPDAEAGTIRGDFGMSKRYNLIHASDSPESAERETALFFNADEIADHPPALLDWVYDMTGEEPV